MKDFEFFENFYLTPFQLAATLVALASAEKPRTINDPPLANTRTTCGGTITGDMTLKTPGYDSPGYYSNGLNCLWTIDMPDASNIVLMPERFHVESASSCRYDRFGHYRDGQELARHCGNGGNPYQPDLAPSRKRRDAEEGRSANNGAMWSPIRLEHGDQLRFITDGSVVFKGVRAKIISNADQESVCGQQLTGSGSVSSPGFWNGETYGDDLNCEYRLQAAPGHNRIKINFSHFHMQDGTDGCLSDRLVINGVNYCGQAGTNGPPTDDIIFTAAETTVSFVTNGSGSGPGWRFDFESFSEEISTSTCIQSLTGSGVVTSEGFDSNDYYPGGENCAYTLNAEPGKHIKIRITYFQLEQDVHCSFDKLIIDGEEYCGYDYPEETIVQAESTVVQFITDDNDNYYGFRFEFESVDQEPQEHGCKFLFIQ